MSAIRKFIKSSGVFFVGSALSKVIVFLMLPIYTKYLPTGDYGYYDVSNTYLSLVIAAMFFEIWSTTLRFMYQSKEKPYKYKIVSNGFTLFSFFLLMFSVVFVVLHIETEIKYLPLIYLFGISLVLVNMFMFMARGMEQDMDFAVSGILNTFIVAMLNILFIVGFHMNFSSLYIATIIGNFFQIIFLEWKTHAVCNIRIKHLDTVVLKQMLKYTLPLCLNTTSYWILSGYSRIVISDTMSLSANGIYAIGNKFSYVIVFATNCFTYAWQGVSFERDVDDKDNGAFYSKACKMYMQFLGIAIVIVLPIFKIAFPYLVDISYIDAADLMPLFLINACMYAYTTFVGNIFAALKKTNMVLLTMGVACALQFVLSYPFIKLWGLNGINFSVFICYLANIFIGYLVLKKHMAFTIDVKLILALFVWVGISLFIYTKMNTTYNLIWFLLCLSINAYMYRSYLKLIIGKILCKVSKDNQKGR